MSMCITAVYRQVGRKKIAQNFIYILKTDLPLEQSTIIFSLFLYSNKHFSIENNW